MTLTLNGYSHGLQRLLILLTFIILTHKADAAPRVYHKMASEAETAVDFNGPHRSVQKNELDKLIDNLLHILKYKRIYVNHYAELNRPDIGSRKTELILQMAKLLQLMDSHHALCEQNIAQLQAPYRVVSPQRRRALSDAAEAIQNKKIKIDIAIIAINDNEPRSMQDDITAIESALKRLQALKEQLSFAG
jgi:hypothetical protein